MSSDDRESPRKNQRNKVLIWTVGIIAAIGIAGGSLYAALVPGLSIAHQEPPAAEVLVATWLLHQSVPDEARNASNPLKDDLAGIYEADPHTPPVVRGPIFEDIEVAIFGAGLAGVAAGPFGHQADDRLRGRAELG